MPPATLPSKTTVYQLAHQIVIGSPISVDVANLVIEDFESWALASYPPLHPTFGNSRQTTLDVHFERNLLYIHESTTIWDELSLRSIRLTQKLNHKANLHS